MYWPMRLGGISLSSLVTLYIGVIRGGGRGRWCDRSTPFFLTMIFVDNFCTVYVSFFAIEP